MINSHFCNMNQILISQYIDNWETKIQIKQKNNMGDIKLLLEEFLHLKKESRKICEIPPDLNSNRI